MPHTPMKNVANPSVSKNRSGKRLVSKPFTSRVSHPGTVHITSATAPEGIVCSDTWVSSGAMK